VQAPQFRADLPTAVGKELTELLVKMTAAAGPGDEASRGTGERMVPRPDHGEGSFRGCDRLANRKTVITGGIGRAVALAFAREGADVLLSYMEQEEADAKQTADLVRQAGRQVVLVPGDLQDEAHCERIVDRAVAEFGRIDVLVNNAAPDVSRRRSP
jgi:hypothetical protein